MRNLVDEKWHLFIFRCLRIQEAMRTFLSSRECGELLAGRHSKFDSGERPSLSLKAKKKKFLGEGCIIQTSPKNKINGKMTELTQRNA
jgi:hypothetical protein